MKLNWNFLDGGGGGGVEGVQNKFKKPSVGGVWIKQFSGTHARSYVDVRWLLWVTLKRKS